jgi:hypothetical protein
MWLFSKSQPHISQRDALAIAQAECQKRGWPWLEPIQVKARWGKWIINTNTQMLGCKARFVIDQQTAQILQTAYLPR